MKYCGRLRDIAPPIDNEIDMDKPPINLCRISEPYKQMCFFVGNLQTNVIERDLLRFNGI